MNFSEACSPEGVFSRWRVLAQSCVLHDMVDVADNCFEAVCASAEFYTVPKELARPFARAIGIKDDQNFPRAMDPNDTGHTFVEYWQGLYNVRWLEKVSVTGDVLGWMLIWGQPSHTMGKFYEAACTKWTNLPAWNTFRLAIAPSSKRKMKGFRVTKLSLDASRKRLEAKDLPLALRAQVCPCQADDTLSLVVCMLSAWRYGR